MTPTIAHMLGIIWVAVDITPRYGVSDINLFGSRFRLRNHHVRCLTSTKRIYILLQLCTPCSGVVSYDNLGCYLFQAEKRAHHNALERKRRDHIKDSFTSLRDSVPALQGEKVVGLFILCIYIGPYLQLPLDGIVDKCDKKFQLT